MPGVRVTSLRPKGKVRPRGGLFAWEKGRGGPQVRWRMQRGGAHAAVGKTEQARSAMVFSGTASRASKASGQKSQQLCKDSWCKTKYFGGLRSWQRACFGRIRPAGSPNFITGCCAVGSAPALGAGGPGFESPHSDQKTLKSRLFRRFFCVKSSTFRLHLTTFQLWSER